MGLQGRISKLRCISDPEDCLVILANSADPDESFILLFAKFIERAV